METVAATLHMQHLVLQGVWRTCSRFMSTEQPAGHGAADLAVRKLLLLHRFFPHQHDDRNQQEHRNAKQSLSVLQQFGNISNDEEGITIETAIGGQYGNSTVAESVGAIVAICGQGPANVGIDNAACVQAARQLKALALCIPEGTSLTSPEVRALQRKCCTGSLRRPWTLQPNGEYWLLLLRCIIAKGPHSVDFCKLKGHAKEEDIESGIISKKDANGNRTSDKVADEGLQQFGEGVLNIARWLGKRHLTYIEVMRRIHQFLLHMMHAIKELLDKNRMTQQTLEKTKQRCRLY